MIQEGRLRTPAHPRACLNAARLVYDGGSELGRARAP